MVFNESDWIIIEEDIKNGAFGKISKAKKKDGCINNKNIGPDRLVAIKKILNNEDGKNEIYNLEIINKQNEKEKKKIKTIVNYYGYSNDEKYIYLFMDFIQYKTIGELLVEKYKFNENQINIILKKCLKFLKFLHEKCNIVYVDLNSNNIMVNISSDGRLSIKFIDFGVSNIIGRKVNKISGTNIAPEFSKNIVYNESIDVWCLGCLAIELLGKDPKVLSDSCEDKSYFILSELNCSNLLKNLISKCIQYKSVYRFNINQLDKHPFLNKVKNYIDFNKVIFDYYNLLKNKQFEILKLNGVILQIIDKQELNIENKESISGFVYIGDHFNLYSKDVVSLKNLKYLSILGRNDINNKELFDILPKKLESFIFNGNLNEELSYCFDGLNDLKHLELRNYNDFPIDLIQENINFLELGNKISMDVVKSFNEFPNSIQELVFGCDIEMIPLIKRENIPPSISFLYINNILYEFENDTLIEKYKPI